jgi:hypothetical protein
MKWWGKKMDGKLSFTQMKILNDIACNLISIQFNSISFHFIPNSIELNSIESKNIELEFNWIQIQLKKNKMKIGVRRYWNFLVIFIICDYGVEFFKNIIINLWKDTNLGEKKKKTHFSIPFKPYSKSKSILVGQNLLTPKY